MKKKNKNLELRIYEILGVKIFKKMVFELLYSLSFFVTFKLSRKERKNIIDSMPSNYVMKKGNRLQDLKNFKKAILFNTGLHTLGFTTSMYSIIKTIIFFPTTFSVICFLFLIIVNLYCLMLQRYNWVRINEVINKFAPHEEKIKNKLKDELKDKDKSLSPHTYKIVNVNKKEKLVTFEDLLNNATIKQLKEYKKHLEIFQEYNNIANIFINSDSATRTAPLERGKLLKIELKLNKSNKND